MFFGSHNLDRLLPFTYMYLHFGFWKEEEKVRACCYSSRSNARRWWQPLGIMATIPHHAGHPNNSSRPLHGSKKERFNTRCSEKRLSVMRNAYLDLQYFRQPDKICQIFTLLNFLAFLPGISFTCLHLSSFPYVIFQTSRSWVKAHTCHFICKPK